MSNTVECGVYGAQFVLPHLAEFVQHLVIIALNGPVFVVGVAWLFEISLDPVKASIEFTLAVAQNFS